MKNSNRTAALRRPYKGPDTLVIVNSKNGSGLTYAKWLMKALDADGFSYEKNKLGYSVCYRNVIFLSWIRNTEITKLSVMRANYSNFHLDERNFIVAAVGIGDPTPSYINSVKQVNGLSDLPDDRFYLLPGKFDPGKMKASDSLAFKASGDQKFSALEEPDIEILKKRFEHGYDNLVVENIEPLVSYINSLKRI